MVMLGLQFANLDRATVIEAEAIVTVGIAVPHQLPCSQVELGDESSTDGVATVVNDDKVKVFRQSDIVLTCHGLAGVVASCDGLPAR